MNTLAALCVVWLPAAKTDWAGLEKLLTAHPELKISIGIQLDGLSAQDTAIITKEIAQDRLEAVLRVPGDPILPLMARVRASDVPQRLANQRGRYREAFNVPPAGILLGSGLLTKPLLSPLRAAGLRWAGVRDYGVPPAGWPRVDGIVLAPLRGIGPGMEAAVAASTEPVVYLLEDDESSGSGEGLAWLERTLSLAGSSRAWATVGFAAAAAAVGDWPPGFDGDDAWSGTEKAAALRDLTDAAAALDRYQNSGQARLAALDAATTEFYAAESDGFFRSSGGDDAGLKAHLAAVYRTIREPVPAGLGAAAQGPAAEPGQVVVETGERRLGFENAPLASGPAAGPDLKRLDVAWDGETVSFSLVPDTTAQRTTLFDVYIDVNHRPGAGSTSLLPGRNAFLRAADAWEYALAVDGASASLYRFGPQKPVLVETLAASADPATGAVRVRLPRKRLSGNPAGWGYAALALRPKPSGPAAVTGAVAPNAERAALRSPPASSFVRITAQRSGGGP